MAKRTIQRLVALGISWMSVALIPLDSFADSLNLTTWYPAPYGVYSQLRSTGNSYFAYQGGSVGIGTTNPQNKLHVQGAAGDDVVQISAVSATPTSTPFGLLLSNNLSTTKYGMYVDYQNVFRLHRALNGVSGDFVINNAGHIGIGTTVPQAQFYISSPQTSYASSLGDFLTKSSLGIKPNYTETTTLWVADCGGNACLQSTNGPATGAFDIALQPYGGNIGIGLANPSDPLSVKANGYVVSMSGLQSPPGPNSGPRIKFGDVGNYNSYLEIGAYGAINNIDNKGRQLHIIGNVDVTGNLSKGGGNFMIDHPLDPKNKVLRHSFVESPDMKNIYDGIVVLDKKGECEVLLPEYFEALNKDFRYQLTPIGRPAPDLYIKSKIRHGKFLIGGGAGGQEVSWQVTGVRHDPYALKHPIIIEEPKGAAGPKKGEYLYPEAFE